MGNFTELDMYLFGQATHYDIYKKLGAHPAEIRKKKGILFDVWAPHAAEVYVIGTFNDWNETANPMRRLEPAGIGIYSKGRAGRLIQISDYHTRWPEIV